MDADIVRRVSLGETDWKNTCYIGIGRPIDTVVNGIGHCFFIFSLFSKSEGMSSC